MKKNKSIDNSTSYYTHGLHPYPAKFTPQMINTYIINYSKEYDNIIDPFCGSGTTLVESIVNNRYAYGIDLNPIAYIISKAKTNLYTSEHINKLSDYILNLQNINLAELNIEVHEFPNRLHWFQENISKELSFLKSYIKKENDTLLRDLLICAFSKIILKVSNQDSEVRYTAKQKNLPDGIVFKLFIATLMEYQKSLQELDSSKIKTNAKIINLDIGVALERFENDKFDLVITSPPYINTFDYYLYHKQRMFWLDYDHKNVRKHEIGNHHRIDTKTLEEAKLEYITSMKNVFEQLNRVLKKDCYFVIIIGDGIVAGEVIDMSSIINVIAKKTNFAIEDLQSVNLSETTKSFNKKFSNAPKKEHTIILKNIK